MFGTLLVSILSFAPAALDDGVAFFEKKIRPVLVQKCGRCHSGEVAVPRGGLRLDRPSGFRRGGDSGPSVIPGDPEASLLIRALRSEDPDLSMPPEGPLAKEVIEDFVRWVALGAPAPEDFEPVEERRSTDGGSDGEDWWSFQPVERPPIPEVQDASWPRSDIDCFVLDALEREGLSPLGEADPRTLLRRLSFVLRGLPPTPEELASYASEPTSANWDRFVDAYLESRAFAQRWGRHWLDVARYADSTGGGRTRALPEAWRYRDYVIDSFHRDKPFDQFIKEQIAGDLLPRGDLRTQRERLVATGFLVLGPNNYENQDKDLLRMEVVDEQIDTTTRAFLGLTVSCARCHDHKFDPIPTTDYYALAGIFRSTKTLTPGNVSGFVRRSLPQTPEKEATLLSYRETLADYDEAIAREGQALKDAEASLESQAPRLSTKRIDKEWLRGIVVDDRDAVLEGDWKASVSQPRYLDEGYVHDKNQGKGHKTITFAFEVDEDGPYDVRLGYSPGSNRDSRVPVRIVHAEGRSLHHVDQRHKPKGASFFTSVGTYTFKKGQAASVTVSNDGTTAHVIADAIQVVPSVEGDLIFEDEEGREWAPLAALERGVEEVQGRLEALKEKRRKWMKDAPEEPKAMAVIDEEETGDWHVHIRGEIRNLGDVVSRGFLSVVAPEQAPDIEEGQSGRLELAQWVADATNPLTPRVMSNRVWHHLMGQGLVRTVDNFGTMGEDPSHPELLDHLATRLIDHGWSIKALIRDVVRSSVFRLSSNLDEEKASIDPDNRLLWRRTPQRLDAEALRDAMLSVSGELDPREGGPSIETGAKGKVPDKVEYGYRYTSKRRSVYLPVFRNALLDFFDVFDFADPNATLGKRPMSTRATQALYMLNSPFPWARAEAWSDRLLAREEPSLEDRLNRACLELYGREARGEEVELAGDFLSEFSEEQGWLLLCHALFCGIDFQYLR